MSPPLIGVTTSEMRLPRRTHPLPEPDPHLGPVEPDLDAFEVAVARRADALGIPVLGICRGCQALNVARGGTLHQHLPDVLGHEEHRSTTEGRYVSHAVRFDAGTAVGALLGASATVNSRHHQGIDDLGTLTASGWAPDGLVEAVEDPTRRFCLGVQWHPEDLDDRRLFAALVEAAVWTRSDRLASLTR
jgi:putative glutamine amidotransferase